MPVLGVWQRFHGERELAEKVTHTHTHTHEHARHVTRPVASRSLQSRLRLGGASGSSSLTDLSQAEEPGRASQQRRAGANATWNSIHNAVIAVFQRKPLPDHELFALNEGVRQLLKTELGSFFTEYLQNQLLTKGMVILRDKIRLYEGQKLLDSCAETWTFFFGEVLSTLQAIFYPVQGKEPSVRQLALLHFRNIITLNLKLDEALSRPRARVPPSIVQMLLVLQGVHESAGVTDDYLRLERLIQSVVSPYLSSQGLCSADGAWPPGRRPETHFRSGPSGGRAPPAVKNLVVRSKSYNVPLLTPVVESDPDSSSGGGVRRHSVSEMTSCAEEAGPGPTVTEPSGPDQPAAATFSGCTSAVAPEPRPGHAPSSCTLPDPWSSEPEARFHSSVRLHDSGPEVLRVHAQESPDSEPDGIFLDFGSVTQSEEPL
ncbi:proline-rich protein 5-like isoform X2 [Synchiropus splendidus]|uniref:proline-rich protein 5-like isoform X2 n=1 Tax=Synchiropus splendidus TaxID=270530 RepID=UPI00237E03AE|nr:proline-rich protein 5-like isoform X2 [Synchiropus splendidus]